MIKRFTCKETEKLFQREHSKRFESCARGALRKLLLIEAAGRIEDLKVTLGNRLERLHGNRAGQYCIRVNDQWRVCFCWQGGNAVDVELVDYP